MPAGLPPVTATIPAPPGVPSGSVTVATWAPGAARAGTGDVAGLDDLPGDVAGQAGRDGETGALGLGAALRAGGGERRDADHLPGGVYKRAAAVAGVVALLTIPPDRAVSELVRWRTGPARSSGRLTSAISRSEGPDPMPAQLANADAMDDVFDVRRT